MPAILFLAALGGFYALAYYLNQSTPLPEGCEDLQAACAGCTSATCSIKPLNVKETTV